MYNPRPFRQDDPAELRAFIARHSFALLCSAGEGGPFATHLPLLLDPGAGPNGTLFGHVARDNPHWRLADGAPVVAVFSGPHAYISPAWYEAEGTVPTWNYVAVHAAGVLRAVTDPDELLRIVRETTDYFEAPLPRPWRLTEDERARRLLGGVVGVRIEIERLEGKWKLGQNRPPEQRRRAARALRERGGDDGRAIADLMEGTIG